MKSFEFLGSLFTERARQPQLTYDWVLGEADNVVELLDTIVIEKDIHVEPSSYKIASNMRDEILSTKRLLVEVPENDIDAQTLLANVMGCQIRVALHQINQSEELKPLFKKHTDLIEKMFRHEKMAASELKVDHFVRHCDSFNDTNMVGNTQLYQNAIKMANSLVKEITTYLEKKEALGDSRGYGAFLKDKLHVSDKDAINQRRADMEIARELKSGLKVMLTEVELCHEQHLFDDARLADVMETYVRSTIFDKIVKRVNELHDKGSKPSSFLKAMLKQCQKIAGKFHAKEGMPFSQNPENYYDAFHNDANERRNQMKQDMS